MDTRLVSNDVWVILKRGTSQAAPARVRKECRRLGGTATRAMPTLPSPVMAHHAAVVACPIQCPHHPHLWRWLRSTCFDPAACTCRRLQCAQQHRFYLRHARGAPQPWRILALLRMRARIIHVRWARPRRVWTAGVHTPRQLRQQPLCQAALVWGVCAAAAAAHTPRRRQWATRG